MSNDDIARSPAKKEINTIEAQPSMDKVTKREWNELTGHTYEMLKIKAKADIKDIENGNDELKEYKKDNVEPIIERILSYQGTTSEDESDLAKNIYERALSHSQLIFSEEQLKAAQLPLWKRILLKIL